MAPPKTFHLSFRKNRRPETRTLVKTQQFILTMNGIFDRQKSFFTTVNAFVFSLFAISGFPRGERWRRRC
jgi:hypothetical protein